jgi:hypothetical protein
MESLRAGSTGGSGAIIAAHLEATPYDEAIPLLRTRLQLEPEHVECLYKLGNVCSDRMQLKEARQLLGRAVVLEPGYANGEVGPGS